MLLTEIPKNILSMWGMLHFIKMQVEWSYCVSSAILVILYALRLLLPCIITEMVNSQVESARLTIHHRMLKENGDKRREFAELLQYMSARRLQHSAWRVIPLDMQLPLAVLSTCVTYLIVIIQFTHLY
ncbi:7tm chemosensory receptor domain-containing protein [Phthorimaea operculella]|nr:7tm chemosensory receptor domain-containing protein [Phthorimaea operculella]KAI5632943.1 7tm chemosensory receptor domain-containing protein [Phthorimaea operculella]